MRLFFETYSIIQTLLLFKYIRQAEVVYFHKRSFPPLKYNTHIKTIVERLLRLFNSHLKVKTLPAEKATEHTWVMNKRALGVVEELAPEIENSAVYKAILKLIGDENILKCYKAQMVDDISARLLFFKMAKEAIIENKSERLYIIPAYNDNTKMQQVSLGEEPLRQSILPTGLIANRIRNFFYKIYSLILFLLLPSGYILLHCKKLTLRKINKGNFDIAMPVLWGFYEKDVIINGVKRSQDDGYLYNKEISPGRIVHVFKYWKFSPAAEESYKQIMDYRGLSYADSADYKINANLLIIAAKIQLKIIRYFLLNLSLCYDRCEYITYSNKIIYWMLEKYLEFENVDYKVEFIRHDYSPHHIVETILCNQRNKKTVGIQHSASPYDIPQLSYTHFNKYIIYSEMFIEEFFPHWEQLNLAKTGRETVDFAVNILRDTSAMFKLKERFRKLYPERKYMIVVAMSADVDYNARSQWDELYRALYNLKALSDIDFNLFLRFRTRDYAYSSENMLRFAKLPLWDERIIVDHINFSTYELMALCDIFIACNASFSINEAIATGARVFTFNLHGGAKYLFRDYGNDFILNTEKDILKVFRGLKNNFKDFDCNWELLKRRCNFYCDGRNLERIQEAVWSLVK